MKRLASLLYRLLASYGLACVIMVLLFLLVLLGTFEQTKLGLYEVQKKYFDSLVLVHKFPGGLKLPLPGVYLLLIIFSVNLLLGVLARLRRGRVSAGMLIVHGGILFLLLGGLITHEFALEGQMALAPGQTGNTFQSVSQWEVALIDTSAPDKDTEYLIPLEDFAALTGARRRLFQSQTLPFDVTLGGYAKNAAVLPKGPMFTAPAEVVDGLFVQEQPADPEVGRNAPALYVTLRDKRTGQNRTEILWGFSAAPLVYEAGGRSWQVWLRRQSWPVPFSVTLKKFTREYHPGTEIARTYQSEVVQTTPIGGRRDVTIRMNEPLRDHGYTFFQSSFFEDPQSGTLSSVLAVVRNPADQFPLYACYIITLGLVMHFGVRLFRYLKKEREQQA